MTPKGHLQSVTAALARFARNGDVEAFRTYLRSETFLNSFQLVFCARLAWMGPGLANGLAPERRQSVMRAHAKAEALCESKARHPLGGDDEKAARILRVSPGSARLAKRRHLDVAGIGHRQNAS
jgi:hypothetical protein